MSTGSVQSGSSIPPLYELGKKTEIKDKDIKKDVILPTTKPSIDQSDTLQSKPVKKDNLKDLQKFPDKPSMGIKGEVPAGAEINDTKKPQPEMGIKGEVPAGAEINDTQKPKPEMGTKPNFPTGKPGSVPPGTKPTLGQKPNFPMGDKGNMGIEGTPPAGATIYPGKKIID
jgi:hypothetical protein